MQPLPWVARSDDPRVHAAKHDIFAKHTLEDCHHARVVDQSKAFVSQSGNAGDQSCVCVLIDVLHTDLFICGIKYGGEAGSLRRCQNCRQYGETV